jgi:hypothetical protein
MWGKVSSLEIFGANVGGILKASPEFGAVSVRHRLTSRVRAPTHVEVAGAASSDCGAQPLATITMKHTLHNDLTCDASPMAASGSGTLDSVRDW